MLRLRFQVMQNFLLDLGLQWELQLDSCTWDNGWCYHGVISSDSLSKSCVHNSASEDICLCHCNIEDRLNTLVRWTPLSEIDEKNQQRSLKFGTFLSTLVLLSVSWRNLYTKIVHHTAIFLRKKECFSSFLFNWSFEKLKWNTITNDQRDEICRLRRC